MILQLLTAPRWRAVFAGLAAAALAVSCGGGGGNVAGGGIGGTGITDGTITGFGSVIVNGQRFEVDDGVTQITLDDAAGAQTNLQVGMIVRIAHTNFTDGRVRADSITYQSDAKGPATVNAAASTVQVAGQTVVVDDDTCIQITADQTECQTGPAALTALAANPTIEVCGRRDSDGRLRATRIRKTGDSGGGGGPVELRGQMSALNTNAKTFLLNGITVSYADAEASGKVSGTLANGATVKVKSGQAPVNNQLTATEVRVESSGGGGSGGGGSTATIEVENLITDFRSATDFDVGAQQVQTTSATEFENGTKDQLAENLKVKVRGKLNASNVLVADLVSLRPTIEIEAQVTSVDVAQTSITLLGSPGIKVKTDNLTTFKDVTFAQIAAGSVLKISAQQSGASIVATRVELEDELDQVVLRAPVASKSSPSLTLLGITVTTRTAPPPPTEFESELGNVTDQTSFFDAVTAGQTVVKVKGTFDGAKINADEAEIELPD